MELSSSFTSMFREYDIRGRVSEKELNPASVYDILCGYAVYLKKRRIGKSIVGYDNRDCSPSFAKAAMRALTDNGIQVLFVGLATSPLVYYAQYLYQSEGAVMITASHNPNGWSGFKLAKGYSQTLETDDIRELLALVGSGAGKPPGAEKGAVTNTNARDLYINEMVSRLSMGKYRPKLVIDAGNGAAGLFAYELFFKLGCLAFQLNCDPDVSYPHYFPNPSDIQARARLKEMVLHPYIQADIGIGFDGDGDRIGVVDEKGQDVYSDIILALLAKQLLRKQPGQPVLYDVKCSKTLEQVILESGGVPLMWKTGHSHIKAKMREVDAPLAGERSGHIFFGGSEYFGFDDALFAAAKLIEVLSHGQKSLSARIAEFPRYVTSPEVKAHCEDAIKYTIVDQLTKDFHKRYPGKVNDLCGARVSFARGWGLVRASSNLPELVLIFEADTAGHLRQIKNVFRAALGRYPAVDPHWQNDMDIEEIT